MTNAQIQIAVGDITEAFIKANAVPREHVKMVIAASNLIANFFVNINTLAKVK